jgi:RNA polymerase sigma factor (sigma-70 family)
MEEFLDLVCKRIEEANLHRYLVSIGCPLFQLDDIVQDTTDYFLRFSVKRMMLPFPEFIRRKARLQYIDSRRRQNIESKLFCSLEGDTLPSPKMDEDSFRQNECCEQVRKAINRLPHKYRVVVELCDLSGEPLVQVASELRIPIETLKTRLKRAHLKIKVALTAYWRH